MADYLTHNTKRSQDSFFSYDHLFIALINYINLTQTINSSLLRSIRYTRARECVCKLLILREY